MNDIVATPQPAVDREYTIFTKQFQAHLKRDGAVRAGWTLLAERCLHRRERNNDSLPQCAGAWTPANRYGYCCGSSTRARARICSESSSTTISGVGMGVWDTEGLYLYRQGPCPARRRNPKTAEI